MNDRLNVEASLIYDMTLGGALVKDKSASCFHYRSQKVFVSRPET